MRRFKGLQGNLVAKAAPAEPATEAPANNKLRPAKARKRLSAISART